MRMGWGSDIPFLPAQTTARVEEHGSANGGDARTVDKKYRDKKDPMANRISRSMFEWGWTAESTGAQPEYSCIGGSGAGKPLLCQSELTPGKYTSYFVLDCKGESCYGYRRASGKARAMKSGCWIF